MLADARKRVADLDAYRQRIIKSWIDEKITQDIYDDQMQQVGTQLEAAGLLEGEAVLELAEVELLLDFADWMRSHASLVWASASVETRSAFRGQFSQVAGGFQGGIWNPVRDLCFLSLAGTIDGRIRSGVPRGIRTPVTAVKGRCPRPG